MRQAILKKIEKSLKKLLTRQNTCDKITELLLRKRSGQQTRNMRSIFLMNPPGGFDGTLTNEQQCNPENSKRKDIKRCHF